MERLIINIFLIGHMFVVCGMENVKVTPQTWEENYHGVWLLEVFPAGSKIRKPFGNEERR